MKFIFLIVLFSSLKLTGNNNLSLEKKVEKSIEFIFDDSTFNSINRYDTNSFFYFENNTLLSLSNLYLTEKKLFKREFYYLINNDISDYENLLNLAELDSNLFIKNNQKLSEVKYADSNSTSMVNYYYFEPINSISIEIGFLDETQKWITLLYFFKFNGNNIELLFLNRIY